MTTSKNLMHSNDHIKEPNAFHHIKGIGQEGGSEAKETSHNGLYKLGSLGSVLTLNTFILCSTLSSEYSAASLSTPDLRANCKQEQRKTDTNTCSNSGVAVFPDLPSFQFWSLVDSRNKYKVLQSRPHPPSIFPGRHWHVVHVYTRQFPINTAKTGYWEGLGKRLACCTSNNRAQHLLPVFWMS